MSWTDVVHLVIYNLSTQKHYNQKYHHLTKEILPFSLQIRAALSMSIEVSFWIFFLSFIKLLYFTLESTIER